MSGESSVGSEVGSSGVQEFRSSGVQEFRSSGVQEFRSSGVQEFRSSVVQEFRSSGVQAGVLSKVARQKLVCLESAAEYCAADGRLLNF